MKKVAVFDLDYCLLNGDATYEFVRRIIWSTPFSWRGWAIFYALQIWGVLGGMPRFLHKNKRTIYISLLRGAKREFLEKQAQLLVCQRLSTRINSEPLAKLRYYQNRGYIIILVSASPDIIVDAVGSNLKANAMLSSQLVFDVDGKCQGRIEDITGLKAEILNRKFPDINYSDSFCISDNVEDLPLLISFGERLAVVSYRDPQKEKFWRRENIPTVFVTATMQGLAKYFVPLMYYFTNRVSPRAFLHLFVGFPILALWLWSGIDFQKVGLLGISSVGLLSLYEAGYLINDCWSIKRESRPTLRVPSGINQYLTWLVLVRLSFSAAAVFLLVLLNTPNVSRYAIGLAGLAVAFFIHNIQDSNLRLLTFPVLGLARMVVPLLIFDLPFMAIGFTVLICYSIDSWLFYFYKRHREEELTSETMTKIWNIPKFLILLTLTIITLVWPSIPGLLPVLIVAIYISLLDVLKIFRTLASGVEKIIKWRK